MTTRQHWIEVIGRDWAAHVTATDAALGPFGREARIRLALKPGETVMDLGCGAGASTVSLAKDVGPEGRVVAVDISPDLLALAKARTAAHPNVELVEADAGEYDFGEAVFDALFSRFGCMLFEDEPRAWANLRRACKPGARVSLVAWREMELNGWTRVPLEAAAEVLENPFPETYGPEKPGPFRWAQPSAFEGLLEGAGFREVVREKLDRKVPYGVGEAGDSPLERALTMMIEIGPLARRLEGESEEVRQAVAKRLRRRLREFEDDDAVRMEGAAWLITAKS